LAQEFEKMRDAIQQHQYVEEQLGCVDDLQNIHENFNDSNSQIKD